MAVELPSTPARVLAVGAHPDDIDFMAAGTLARWASEGAQVTYCVITDGTAGSRDPSMTHARLAALRQDEQRAAATAVGASAVIFLGYRDGRLQHTWELRLALARVIRQVRPTALIVGDPTVRWAPNYINHPDHIAAADATLAAIMPTANTLLAAPELLDEGLEPHDVEEVYLASFGHGTVWIPLDEQQVMHKAAALREHHSQLDGWDIEQNVREWSARTAEVARQNGLECQFAECFTRIVLRQPPPVKADEAIVGATVGEE